MQANINSLGILLNDVIACLLDAPICYNHLMTQDDGLKFYPKRRDSALDYFQE